MKYVKNFNLKTSRAIIFVGQRLYAMIILRVVKQSERGTAMKVPVIQKWSVF
jgi:hypothetical protein